jgi:hypothetical protein
MKKVIQFMSIMLLSTSLSAQNSLPYVKFDEIKNRLIHYKLKTNEIYEENSTYLISTYTFRSLVQQDYSKITIGENSFSKIGRYATVNFDSDESKFYFTPFTFVVKSDPLSGPFKYIHSVDLSGEINSQNIFDFKNKKSLKAGYSFTKVFAKYKPKQDSRNTSFHSAMVDEVYKQSLSEYERMKTSFSDYLDIASEAENEDTTGLYKEVKKRFFKKLEDIELKYYGDKWARKKVAWLKVNITPFSWDNFSYISPGNTASDSGPIDKSVYTGNVKFSYNTLYTFPAFRNLNFYYSGYVSLTKKHSLSEISSPSQWQKTKLLTDSTFTLMEDKKVYSLNEQDFKARLRPDIGLQVIVLINTIKNTPLGLDLATSVNGLVAEDTDAYVSKNTIGLLIPFLDKKGESTINFEFFYQRKSYKKINLESQNLWGVKFGLPFSSL